MVGFSGGGVKYKNVPFPFFIFKSYKSRLALCRLGIHFPLKTVMPSDIYEVNCRVCQKAMTPEDWNKVYGP